MRLRPPLFALACGFLAVLAVPADAQPTQTKIGVATLVLAPSTVEVTAERPVAVQGLLNASITCDSGYAPGPLELAPDRQALENENGDQVWRVEPDSVFLEFVSVSQDTYEANMNITFDVSILDEKATDTVIRFHLNRHEIGFPSSDCSLFGSQWNFEDPNDPPSLEARRPAPVEPTSPAQSDSDPVAMNPADVLAEEGAVTGSSYVPAEAFWSLGLVLAAFASSAAYGFRRR